MVLVVGVAAGSGVTDSIAYFLMFPVILILNLIEIEFQSIDLEVQISVQDADLRVQIYVFGP